MPEIISATYQITTPMFIGDSEQIANDITPASVKGALRFWWRALNWGRIRLGHKSDEDALKILHEQEAELFGSSLEKGSGQAKFMLRIEKHHIIVMDNHALNSSKEYNLGSQKWQSYMLGQGLMAYDKNLKQNQYNAKRSAIVSGQFTVNLIFRHEHINYVSSIEETLLIWGLLGGLGSRNRRGIGSISIESITGGEYSAPKNQENYTSLISKLISKVTSSYPPFTAFSQQSFLIVSKSSDIAPWVQLGSTAKEFQLYRGWGYSSNGKHKINGIEANHTTFPEKNSDHQLVYNIPNIQEISNITQIPESCVFGLPRIYNLSTSPRKEIKIEPVSQQTGDENTRSRRSSPLFFHVHKFAGSNKSLISQLLLPATFLPPNDEICLMNKRNKKFIPDHSVFPPSTPNWKIINDYLKKNEFSDWKEVHFE